MAGGAQHDHAALREATDRSREVPEHVPVDVLQVGQQPVLGADNQHAGLPPASRDTRTEVVVGQDHADRAELGAKNDMLIRTCDTDHALGVEGHGHVELVLQTMEILGAQVAPITLDYHGAGTEAG